MCTHHTFCPLPQAWHDNCPFNGPITRSNYKHDTHCTIGAQIGLEITNHVQEFCYNLMNRWKVIFSDESFSTSTFFNSDICKLLSPEKEVRIFLLHLDRAAYIKDPWFQNCWVFFFSRQPWAFFNHYLLVWETNKYIQYIFGDMNYFVLR